MPYLLKSFKFLKFVTPMLGLCVVLANGAAQAAVRAKSVCPGFPLRTFPTLMNGQCFSGHPCKVGVRGDFLDLTSRVAVASGPTASLLIQEKGVSRTGLDKCVPAAIKDREGYVLLDLTNILGAGTMSIRMSRPNAFGGQDADVISVTVHSGETFLSHLNTYSADLNVQKDFSLRGGNLTLLQLKNPVTGDAFVSKSASLAVVRLKFARTGTVNLDERLEFTGGEPPLNRIGGWPSVAVLASSSSLTPPTTTVSPLPTTSVSSVPNLTPQRLLATNLLIRKINTLASTMVDSAFCIGFANNEEREVAVPDFEWGVANDDRVAINTPFNVAVINGASNATLITQQVASIPKVDIRTFKNWTGRPATIRVVKVTGTPLIAEYQNTAGCYLPNASASSVVLDPKPLIIRADSTNRITERVETDNDLRID